MVEPKELRDWFAGRAAASLILLRANNPFSEYKDSFVGFEVGQEGMSDAECLAEQAYIIADALLAQSALPPFVSVHPERTTR